MHNGVYAVLGDDTMFPCNKCGLCCSHIDLSYLGAGLDRGDGVCKNFDETTNLCTIYEVRPIMCNVDRSYEIYFKSKLSLEEYYNINLQSCKVLKRKYGG